MKEIFTRFCHKRSGSFIIILSLAALAAGLSGAVTLNDIVGTWRADFVSSRGIRVQSCYVVGQKGNYILYLTNYVAGQKRTAIVAGTLSLSNVWLIDTITNDITGNTLVPRVGDVYKIIDFEPGRLLLEDPDSSKRIYYLKDK